LSYQQGLQVWLVIKAAAAAAAVVKLKKYSKHLCSVLVLLKLHLLEPLLACDCRLDWRQVWSCLERAQQGPWQMDISKLTPAVAPNGVVFTMELLLQQPAPPMEAANCEQQAVGWRDNVIVLSFVLDGKSVEIVVDASGR
jgi:hypothetical protein